MLVRHPQPADLDKGGKFWTRVQSSPTPECTRINLLNQVPQTHALGGIQTWLATGPRTAAMHCHKLPNPYAPTGFRAEDREGRPTPAYTTVLHTPAHVHRMTIGAAGDPSADP